MKLETFLLVCKHFIKLPFNSEHSVITDFTWNLTSSKYIKSMQVGLLRTEARLINMPLSMTIRVRRCPCSRGAPMGTDGSLL